MNEQHGTTQVERRGSVIYARIEGAFNLIGAAAGIAKVEALAANYGDAPWGKLTDMRGCMLGAPDTLPLITSHNQWCADHGCIGIALVVDTGLVKELYIRNSQGCSLVIATFHSPEEANNWLIQRLDEARRQNQ